MLNYRKVGRIAPLLAILYGGCSLGALAQSADAPPPPGASTALETIEVTGSRIRDTDAISANPITVVSSEAIAKTSSVQLEDILRKTPAVDFTGGASGNDGYGGFGASFVSLRNLGAQRTLVLVNGERFPYTDNESTDLAVDLNNIPVSIIDHVDILRDGASSIYGADALGGVINIITQQHFNGVEVGGTVGETSYADGLKYGVYSTVGADLDHGNVLLNASYQDNAAIPQRDRAWSNNEYIGTDAAYDFVSSRVPGAIALINNGVSTTKYYFYNQAGNFQPVSNSGFFNSHLNQLPPGVLYTGSSIVYDYEPTELLNTSQQIKSFNAQGHYDLTDDITMLADGFYTSRYSVENQNPQPVGYNIGTPKFPNGLFIPAYLENGFNADGSPIYLLNGAGQKILNPYNPTTIGNKIVADPAGVFGAGAVNTDVPITTRRFEDGPRYYQENVDTVRLHVGLTGTLLSTYDWSVNYLWGQSQAVDKYVNDVNFLHLAQESGQYACGADALNGCSLANFFGYNTLTPSQAKYLGYTETRNSLSQLSDTNGNISGPVPYADLPGGPVKASIGFEYRSDSINDQPDSVQVNGDADSTAAPTQGSYSTASGFIEVNAPLLKDVPFAKMLTIDASSRYDYNTVFSRALTYKAGFDWAVNDDVRFRGGRSTGYRAPQLKELYGGLFEQNPGGNDPCAPGGKFVNNPTCLAQIRAADPSYNPAVDSLTQINQLNAETGGNPALRPETSQEWDLGTVLTPHWIKNFSVAADFYQVLIRDSIGIYDPNATLNFCYGGVPYAISQGACFRSASNPNGLIGPRTATGDLGFIYTLADNLGNENTSGIDISVNYSFDAKDVSLPDDWGHVILFGQADYLLRDTFNLPTGAVQQAGTYNGAQTAQGDGGTGEPRWKAMVTSTFVHDDLSFYLAERYYGGLKAQQVFSESGGGCGTTVGCGDYFGNEAAGVFYTDLSVSYTYDQLHVTVGVDNLFDKDPPLIAAASSAGALSDAGYDFTGRYIYMKASVKFGLPSPPSVAAASPLPPTPVAVAPAPVTTAPEAARQFQVFFDFNKSDITDAAARVIRQAADVIKAGGVAHIIVTGHTDTVGTAAYNQVLSESRAKAVKAKLVTDGVDGGEIATNGVGKTGLLVPTADGVREPQNRRAVIELL